ncbi:sigma-70 family RNA polymerase sigma factor [Streptomyces sp. N2-109]|uniref:Sigma-70 family RNA polymerase sigma factor n=1 Tax=Streptomyces gossypii TaxID=2883101 RepID=A0ABT2K1T9_9ACTN|nr:sigma-70 family RNA polymerase sigma factor [Streptomyces gossypii]MCT2594135.1 sigma-70 family RNA polymerase sigma factor [Streptomyces gossypii]
MTGQPPAEDLLRRHAPQVLGALVRRYGHFSAAEDAVQEALLAAAVQWRGEGIPENPRGWLIRVASRRLTDQLRSEEARRRREETAAAMTPRDDFVAPPPGEARAPSEDDTLTLLFLCCHPQLSAPSQVALTLRAVGGLTTAEIARAYLVPEATMAQRISRAKQRVKAAGARFRTPPPKERAERLDAVLQVLYLIFNEGYTASAGEQLHRTDLSGEAIRLTRAVRRLLPDDGEVTGLLALMLLSDARRAARTGPGGELIPLAAQDRGRWDQAAIKEGVELVEHALRHFELGPYQVQAAIAAVHDEAADAERTDWPQILALYDLLDRFWPGPMVSLSHAVAVAMVRGPRFGLALLERLDEDPHLAGHHRLAATRGHLLERAGDTEAARLALSLPERRYLQSRAARLSAGPPG